MSAQLCLPLRDDHHLVPALTRVAAGDEAAFRVVHDATSAHVARVVTRTLRRSDLVPEIVQEVFLHVWQHADSYDPGRGSVHGWLAMHAHRRAVDCLRSVVRAAARDQRDAAERGDVNDDVAELGIARCEAARVRAALLRLTPLQREAVELTFLQDFSHVQVAALLDVPLGTVKSRVRSGLIGLRQHIVPLAPAA